MHDMRMFSYVVLVFTGLLSACASAPPPSVASPDPRQNTWPAPSAAAPSPHPDAAVSYANIDRYKEILARHVVRRNADHTFTGPLPPLLPAIVVLRISVDRAGKITNMYVQRSIDDQASSLAMASMRRSVDLPRPHNLLGAGVHALTYSETFLFNKDYRFQVRSLAPPQLPID